MPEIRINSYTGKSVIIASERANRPYSDGSNCVRKSSICPFCKGSEEQTPLPTDIVCYPGATDWALRSVPNRFPALVPSETWSQTEYELEFGANSPSICEFRQPANGRHEVIIESPNHDKRCGLLGDEQWNRLTHFYAYKVSLFYKDSKCKYVQLFKNQGRAAGASLEHVHSQIMGLPWIPPTVQNELSWLERYANQTGRCAWKDILKKELLLGKRIVEKTKNFVVLCPFISRFAGETWIMPRDNRPDMENSSAEVLDELASLISWLTHRLENVLLSLKVNGECLQQASGEEPTPSFNIVYRTAPRIDGVIPEFYSWRMELIPRINAIAGFELGTGCFINVLPPEDFKNMLTNCQ